MIFRVPIRTFFEAGEHVYVKKSDLVRDLCASRGIKKSCATRMLSHYILRLIDGYRRRVAPEDHDKLLFRTDTRKRSDVKTDMTICVESRYGLRESVVAGSVEAMQILLEVAISEKVQF
jgi:hypothetical protein